MLNHLKLITTKLLNDPNTRAVIILGLLIMATLIGGAPNEDGGS